jgi:hypothetical protein
MSVVKPYCGYKDVPKGRTRGTLKECVKLGDIAYYGKQKIDPLIINRVENEKLAHKLIIKIRVRINKLMKHIKSAQGRYKKALASNAEQYVLDHWKKNFSELIALYNFYNREIKKDVPQKVNLRSLDAKIKKIALALPVKPKVVKPVPKKKSAPADKPVKLLKKAPADKPVKLLKKAPADKPVKLLKKAPADKPVKLLKKAPKKKPAPKKEI